MQIARRRGMKKAIMALPRRLAVIMHRIWVDGTEFRWTREIEKLCCRSHPTAVSRSLVSQISGRIEAGMVRLNKKLLQCKQRSTRK